MFLDDSSNTFNIKGSFFSIKKHVGKNISSLITWSEPMRPCRVTFCSVACSKRKDDWARLMHQQMWRAMGQYPLGIWHGNGNSNSCKYFNIFNGKCGKLIEHHRTTYLSIYRSTYLPTYLSIYRSIDLSVYIYLSIHPSNLI